MLAGNKEAEQSLIKWMTSKGIRERDAKKIIPYICRFLPNLGDDHYEEAEVKIIKDSDGRIFVRCKAWKPCNKIT